MSYIFKRALGISLMLYITTFVVGIIAGMILGADMSSMNNVPESFWYIGMVAAVVLSAVFVTWYLKNPALVPSAKSGFLFGLTATVISFLLDFILFSLGNMGGANVDLGQYYGNFRFWIIVVLVVLTATLVGHGRRTKNLLI
jgi:hypothetical protein